MPTSPMREVLHHLRSTVLCEGAQRTDAQLLDAFVDRRESGALEVLVRRHGPMVWGVCRRILGNPHDAEDAFQATFLVLVRRAASVAPRERLGNWLHGVARQTARKARAGRSKRRTREAQRAMMPEPAVVDPDSSSDLQPLLDQELGRLPDRYRVVLVLCDLEGNSRKAAARQLGLPEGTVASRLARARGLLARRLARHGFPAIGGALAAALAERAASASVPAPLVSFTIQTLTRVAAGQAAARGLLSPGVCTLAEGVMKTLVPGTGKQVAAVLVLVALCAAGAAALAQRTPAGRPLEENAPAAGPAAAKGRDLNGDLLPRGAVARLGTVRMRHGHGLSGAAFSRDGKSIFASDFSSGVHVWDVAQGKEVRRFYQNDYWCHCLALSPDGRTLAVALGDCSVRLCDPGSGRELGLLPRQGGRLSNLVFSPDGTLLATGTGYGKVHIWRVATRRLVHEVTFAPSVWTVSFSADGKLLACGTADGHCHLWDLARGKEVRRLSNQPAGSGALCALFAPRGGYLAVWGYKDRSVRLFDADGVREIRRFQARPAGDRKPTSPWGWQADTCVQFSPSGKILAVYDGAGRIDLWDVPGGKRLHTLAAAGSHHPSALVFSPDGTRLASAGGNLWAGDHAVRVWDVARGQAIHRFAGHGSAVSSVALSPGGKTVATAGEDGVIHLWERSSGRHLFRLEGHRGRRPQVSFSSDGRRLTWWGSWDGDGSLRRWEARTARAVGRLELRRPDAFWRTISDDGKTALSVDLKGRTVRYHDLTTGKVTREVADGAYYQPVALSPTGDRVVCSDGTLRNAADWKTVRAIGRLGRLHPSAWFSADGRWLIAAVVRRSSGLDVRSEPPAEEIAVIDPLGGRELRRFGTRVGTLHGFDAVALSRDGRTVVTARRASADHPDEQIITLWETETGRERGSFRGHRGSATSAAISADGRFVVTGASDTTALVWDATRPLTRGSLRRREAGEADVAACFNDLAGADAERAYASGWALVNAPARAVAFLARQRGLFARTDERAIRRWIRDLDSDTFAERERATRELAARPGDARSYLTKALEGKPSLEVRYRIERLLERGRAGLTGKELQTLRVIEILERIAAPPPEAAGRDATRRAATALLEKIAAADPGARLTQEARASLGRVQGRGG